MNKPFIYVIIILLLSGYMYYDSKPKKVSTEGYGYSLKLFAAAEKGDLVILKEKSKKKSIITSFRVVDSSPDDGLRIQFSKKINKILPLILNEYSLNERMGLGSAVKNDFVKNDSNFEPDTFNITRADIKNLKAKYYISTYGPDVKIERQRPGNFPSNIWSVIFFTIGLISTRWFNGYIKSEIALEKDIILYVVIILTAGYFASKHSGELLLTYVFNLYFVKNLIFFFSIYFILAKIKKKYLGLDFIEYLVISLLIIIGIGSFAEYFGGKLIATIQIIKTGLSGSPFLNQYQTITPKGYLISPFIYISWWFYFVIAYFISKLFEQMVFRKNDIFSID